MSNVSLELNFNVSDISVSISKELSPWYIGFLLTVAYQRRFYPPLSALAWIINNVQFCCVQYMAFQFMTKELTAYCTSLDGPNDQHVTIHMQYTHPHLVLTCSTALMHTHVESSCPPALSHTHVESSQAHLHKHTHLSWIFYAVPHALCLSHAHTVYTV
jgi:hypothetical protein